MSPLTGANLSETDLIKSRYEKRKSAIGDDRYAYMNPSVYMAQQEKERALISLLKAVGWRDVSTKRALEVGCGSGGNLQMLMRLGFDPGNLVGNELLLDRYESARRSLPTVTNLVLGDASKLDLPDASFDMVMQSTVFTSIMDDAFQQQLADSMWRLVKPGGGVLWYDFTFNNPSNSDVRGVRLSRVKELFPGAKCLHRRVSLAPPISRRVCKLHPQLYTVFNSIFILRTHILCWLEKPV